MPIKKVVVIWSICWSYYAHSCETIEKDLRINPSTPSYNQGKFPYNEDKLVDLIYTSCCEPQRNLPEAQSLLIHNPSLEPFYLKESDDGRYQIVSSKAKEEKVLMRVKRGQDGRTRITNTHEFPYSFHGHLIMTFANNKRYVGSGILVGPHHVLTAAHNLYSHKNGEGWATKVTFIPGHDEDRQPFGQIESSILLSLKSWHDSKRKEDDIAMIILDESIGYKTGWAGLLSVPDEFIKAHEIHVTGYPGDKGEEGKTSTQMWTMQHVVKNITPEKIEYEIDTCGGQSGSGVWAFIDELKGYHVLGVHTYGTANLATGFNSGTRLSSEKIKLILSWMDKYQLPDFIHPALPPSEFIQEQERYRNIKTAAKSGDAANQYQLANYFYFRRQFVENVEKLKLNFYTDDNKRRKVYIGASNIIATQEDYKRAWKWYQESAQQNYLEALVSLGECYEEGKGTEKDFIKAGLLYHKAAKLGSSRAQANLGRLYYKGWGVRKDYPKAVNLLKQGADQGNALAQRMLGGCYYYGEGVEKNPAEAVNLFKQAVDQGDAIAQRMLGICYYEGGGVEQNSAEAVNLFKQAVDQGDVLAQRILGICYENGYGAEKNPAEAVKRYRQAADQGDAVAQRMLGNCYRNGKGVKKSLAKAVKWYRQAADQGDAVAQRMLGDCYYDGDGVEKNPAKAVKWYRQAAGQGDADAQCNLGFMYEKGRGVEKNLAEAVKWYRQAADQGDADAQYNLGNCYYDGYGVKKNLAEAVKWYRQAAGQGNADAQSKLEKILGSNKNSWGIGDSIFKLLQYEKS